MNTDVDRDVRWRAAEAPGKIGNETAIKPLKKALDDEDTGIYFRIKVKDKAFEALEKISKRIGVRILQTTEDS